MDAELLKYLHEFLNKHRSTDSGMTTHVSMGEPRGNFYINRYDLEQFWGLYCDYIWEKSMCNKSIKMSRSRTWPVLNNNNNNNSSFKRYLTSCVAEKLVGCVPVIIDVDLESATRTNIMETGETLYSIKHIYDLIRAYINVIMFIFEDVQLKELICVVLEKPPYIIERNGERRVKNGFHLHFPKININVDEQKAHIYPRASKSIEHSGLFDDIKPVINCDKIVDDHIYSSPWLLYGSQKNVESGFYRITNILMPIEEKSDENDIGFKTITIEEAFSDMIKSSWRNNSKPIEWYLPRLLSVIDIDKTRVCKKLKSDVMCPLKYDNVKEIPLRSEVIDNGNLYTLAESLEIATELIEMISDTRAGVYDDWMRVGWALYNIGEATHTALNIWLNFSSRCKEKYNESETINIWNRMVRRNVTLGTLRYFAYLDNPDKYNEYCKKLSEKYVSQSLLNPSHYDIAKLMCNDYGVDFACLSYSKKVWVYFKDHIWNESDEGIHLRQKISTKIVSKYTKFEDQLRLRIASLKKMKEVENKDEVVKKVDDDDDKIEQKSDIDGAIDKADKKMKAIQKLINNLKQHTFKNSIMNESREVFYNDFIAQKLNTNPYIIAFANGIYDLKNDIFRDGRPDDFVSTKMPIRYRKFSEDDIEVLDVKDFLSKVFPDESVRNYFMDVMSEVFEGKNSRKHVYVWTGDGDNGKSVTQLFFEKMFGPLCAKPPTSLITGKRTQSSSASPEFARLGNGVRWVVFDEPEKKEVINTGILKQLSGNDTYYARKLYSDGVEIVPMFRMCLICLSEGTLISLADGTSLPIEELSENKTQVLAFSKEDGGIRPSNQSKFIYQGEKECVTLKFLDGREITCTPDHRFLTTEGDWIEARDIKLGETQLILSINNPKVEYNINDKLVTCGYEFDREKGMALCRLTGYMLTDGTLNRRLYLGHKIDCEAVLRDIFLLTQKVPVVGRVNNTYSVFLPIEITKIISDITPVQKGGRSNNEMVLPEFLFNQSTPIVFVRECIAAMFGGDGIVPCLQRNKWSFLRLVASKSGEFVESLVSMYERLSRLMQDIFNVNSFVSEPKIYSNDKYHVFLEISKDKDKLNFAQNIGFRYCCHKSYRMMAVQSYLSYRNDVINQTQKILEKSREYIKVNKWPTIQEAVKHSLEEVENDYIVDKRFVKTLLTSRGHYFTYGNDYKQPSIDIKEYLQTTGLCNFVNNGSNHHYSVNFDENVLPIYSMVVIGRKKAGIHPTYDITIDKYSNFLAEGVVAHNCNLPPILPYDDKAVWNRIRVIPFEAVFLDFSEMDEPKNQKIEYKFCKDPHISDRIPDMVEALAWMLLEHRKTKDRNLYEPEKVKLATEKYRTRSDTYMQFVAEETDISEEDVIHVRDLYENFKEWYRRSYPGHVIPIRSDMEDYFNKVWDRDNVIYKGHKLRASENINIEMNM